MGGVAGSGAAPKAAEKASKVTQAVRRRAGQSLLLQILKPRRAVAGAALNRAVALRGSKGHEETEMGLPSPRACAPRPVPEDAPAGSRQGRVASGGVRTEQLCRRGTDWRAPRTFAKPPGEWRSQGQTGC